MPISFSTLTLVAVLTLALFSGLLVFSFWSIQREDKAPLWLALWLAASALFALCRLMQYASLDDRSYVVIPRILLTASYTLAWLGYELGNAFIGFRPLKLERILVIALVSIPLLFLWGSSLILTGEIVTRTNLLGGTFHGVLVGAVYLPVNFLILGLGILPAARLLRTTGPNMRDNRLMATGFLIVVIFSLNDFISTALNLVWVRLSDFSYLPIAIFFCYIQVRRFGRLYRDMDVMVRERTLELQQTNQSLNDEISERARTEEALTSSEERYRQLIDSARDVIFTLAPDSTITSLNPAFEESTGWTQAEWLGRPFSAFVTADNRSWVYSQFLRILNGEKLPAFRLNVQSKMGKMMVIEVNVTRQINHDQVVGVLGIARNMTEEQRAEEALRASEKRFRTLIENNADGIALISSDGTILYASPMTMQGLDLSVEAIIGRNILEMMPPDDAPILSKLFAQLQQSPGMKMSDQVQLQDLKGEMHWYEGIGHNLLDDPDVRAIVVNYRDITVRKQHEEKILQNAAEMAALYDTTHDLVIERDLTKLLLTIVERATNLVNGSGGALYLCEPEQRRVRCVVSYNIGRDFTGVVLKYGEGAAGMVAQTGEPLLIDDYRVWLGRAALFEPEQPFLSILSVPMGWQGQVIGVIHVLDNTRRSAFTQENLRVVDLFANQAALAIENSRLFQSDQRQFQETAALAEVSHDISSSLQLDVVLERIASHAKTLLHAETSAVYLSEPNQPILKAISAIGPDADQIKQADLDIGKGILGDIAIQKKGEIVNNAAADPRAITIRGTETVPAENLLGVPVLTKDQLTGLIAVWRIGEDLAFKPSDLDFLINLAGQAAIAIENARLFEFTQHRLAELEILQTIASALRVAQTLDEALPIIFDQLIKLLHVDSSSLELLDPVSKEIVTEMACGQWAPVTGLRTPMNDGVSGRVITTSQPYITNHVLSDGLLVRPDLVGGLNVVACVPVVAQHQPIGALWVGRQNQVPFTQEEVNSLTALGEMVGNTIQRMKLHEQTERQADEIVSAYDLTLEGWAKALELRDKVTEGHSRRVTDFTVQLAHQFGITDSEMVHIRRGVLLHDIGKMGVSDQVLKKTGPLNPQDWEEMRRHPRYAYELIHPITYLRPALDIPYCHHEHWDGSGYPRGLSGEEIPLPARIFAIVDVYDALSSNRPYRSAWPRKDVINYLREQSGKLFDPKIVDAFLPLIT